MNKPTDVVEEFDEYHKGYDGRLQRTLLGIAKKLRDELIKTRQERDEIMQQIDVLEIDSPESDEWMAGFEDCRQRVMNIIEPWPNKGESQ